MWRSAAWTNFMRAPWYHAGQRRPPDAGTSGRKRACIGGSSGGTLFATVGSRFAGLVARAPSLALRRWAVGCAGLGRFAASLVALRRRQSVARASSLGLRRWAVASRGLLPGRRHSLCDGGLLVARV